jgi:hypothetical protein
LFIFDALAPVSGAQLQAAADDLERHLDRLGPQVQTARHLITPAGTNPRQEHP